MLENIVVDPFALPMVCPPIIWSKHTFGGFLFNNELKEGLIRGPSKHGLIIIKLIISSFKNITRVLA